jgi:hypothetical protein
MEAVKVAVHAIARYVAATHHGALYVHARDSRDLRSCVKVALTDVDQGENIALSSVI